MREDFQLAAVELLRPMALFTGFLRGAQVMNGSWYGAWKGLECRGEDLPRARDFRLYIPSRSGADMTLHTPHSRMRGKLVRRILGMHNAVTGHAAKLDGVGVLISLIASARAHQHKYHQKHAE